MAKLVLLPIAEKIVSGTYLLYDGACGTGGMLTVAEETLQQIAKDHGKKVCDSPFRTRDQRRDLRDRQGPTSTEGEAGSRHLMVVP